MKHRSQHCTANRLISHTFVFFHFTNAHCRSRGENPSVCTNCSQPLVRYNGNLELFLIYIIYLCMVWGFSLFWVFQSTLVSWFWIWVSLVFWGTLGATSGLLWGVLSSGSFARTSSVQLPHLVFWSVFFLSVHCRFSPPLSAPKSRCDL